MSEDNRPLASQEKPELRDVGTVPVAPAGEHPGAPAYPATSPIQPASGDLPATSSELSPAEIFSYSRLEQARRLSSEFPHASVSSGYVEVRTRELDGTNPNPNNEVQASEHWDFTPEPSFRGYF